MGTQNVILRPLQQFRCWVSLVWGLQCGWSMCLKLRDLINSFFFFLIFSFGSKRGKKRSSGFFKKSFHGRMKEKKKQLMKKGLLC